DHLLANVNAGGGGELVAPGTKSQYLNDVVVGGEYEVIPDVKIGAAYIHRDLGRVLEDMSTDGGNTYVVANPGEKDDAAIAALRQQATMSGDATLAARADLFEGAATLFDKPNRTYDA